MPTLKVGDKVWITELKRYGEISGKAPYSKSYYVDTQMRHVRRNLRNLIYSKKCKCNCNNFFVNEQEDSIIFGKDYKMRKSNAEDVVVNKSGVMLDEDSERSDVQNSEVDHHCSKETLRAKRLYGRPKR